MAQELASTAVGTSAAAAGMGAPAPTSLAPGFRFHPTDEELVRYYLRRKVCGKPFRFQPVTEYDVYKSEPWELADHSSLKTRDLEWYFFSPVDRKYGNGSRLNRATEQGFWKATGKDRTVHHNNQTIGTKKTLVFHRGRAPDGIRTNWVMHEYRLSDPELESARVVQNAFVLCRIFHKSGMGPPNADRYAPFVEEEWDAESGLVVPGGDDVANGDEAALVHYTDAHQDNQPLRIASNSRVHMPLSLSRNKRSRHDDPEDSTTTFDLEKTVPPGYLKFISNLENKILNISMEKEALKIEVMRAQAMINTLQSRVQMLTNNDEEEVRVRI